MKHSDLHMSGVNLLIMAGLSFVAMYILMYAMVDTLGNVYANLNQFYMAGLMTVAMMLIEVVLMALNLYWYIILASVILSWLVAFGVINTYNSTVRTIIDVIYRLTEPALRPIRRVLPDFGSVDLSPIALWLIIYFLMGVLGRLKYAI